MSANQPVVPYQGPPATPNTFATAFPEVAALVEGKAKRGVTYLDPLSLKRLDDLRRQMMASPPPHATVINILPWELSFTSGMPLLRGLQVPACHPGMPYAYYHIRSWRTERELMSDDGGSWSFSAITPIMQAGQFVREFLNKDNMGCGIIIYEGGQHPDKVKEVETYDAQGNPTVTEKRGVMYDEEQREIPSVIQTPVRSDLHKMIEQHRERRNQIFFSRVEEAEGWYRAEKYRHQVTNNHHLMADVLVSEGVIPVTPFGVVASRLKQGLSEENCAACGQIVKASAYHCEHCGNIIDPFRAYMDSFIKIDHAKMEKLTAEQWEEVEKEEERRDKAKTARAKALAKATKKDKD